MIKTANMEDVIQKLTTYDFILKIFRKACQVINIVHPSIINRAKTVEEEWHGRQWRMYSGKTNLFDKVSQEVIQIPDQITKFRVKGWPGMSWWGAQVAMWENNSEHETLNLNRMKEKFRHKSNYKLGWNHKNIYIDRKSMRGKFYWIGKSMLDSTEWRPSSIKTNEGEF